MARARKSEPSCPHCQAPPSADALRDALLALWPTLPLLTQMILVHIAERARPLPADAPHGRPIAYAWQMWEAKHK